jgi:hypothetical protein
MSKWEYMCLEWYSSKQMNTNMLNAFGGEGWELIQIVNSEAVLKRKISEEKKAKAEDTVDDPRFEDLWRAYRRKGSKKKALEQWNKLTLAEQMQVESHMPAYVESVSDVKYQKDFERYLRDKCFLNVVYKDGNAIFDGETPNEPQKEDKLVVNGVIYR